MLIELLLLTAIVLLLYQRWIKRDVYKLGKQLNSGVWTLPFIGHSYLFLGDNITRMKAFQILGRDAIRKYNGLSSMWHGNYLYTMIAEPDVAELVLKTCLEKDDLMKMANLFVGNGSVFAPVSIWRPRRKFLVPSFRMKRLKHFMSIFVTQSIVLVHKMRPVAGSGPLQAFKYFTTYTMDAIAESSLGYKMGAQKDPNQPFLQKFDEGLAKCAERLCQPWLHSDFVYTNLPVYPRLLKMKQFLWDFVTELIKTKRKEIQETEDTQGHNEESSLGYKMGAQKDPNQPFLQKFDEGLAKCAERLCQPWLHSDFVYTNLPVYPRLLKMKQFLWDFVTELIKTKRKEIQETEDTQGHNEDSQLTFLEYLIRQSGGGEGYTDIEIVEELMVLMVAGNDTSAVGASFISVLLARHPEVQDKAYQELLEVFGDSDRSVTFEDLPRLKYLDAVIRETLRLYPPVPVITRKVEKDVLLPCGIKLVPGTGVIVNIWALHRNPRYWGDDAELFRPERFLDTPLTHPAAFMPFSHGPRNCVGYQYAMMSMKTVLSTVLRRYRILPAAAPNSKSEYPPLRLKFDLMMKDEDGFQIQIESRY